MTGAQVWLVPKRHTLYALGLNDVLVPNGWTHATTDAHGDYVLASECLRDLAAVTPITHMRHPWLLVLHPERAPVLVECGDAADETHDVVMSVRAARWSAHVVDEEGRPLAGARVRVTPWDSWQRSPQ